MNGFVKKLPLILAATVCVISLVIMVVVLTAPPQTRVEFTPPPFEENAVLGIPDVPEDLGWTPLDTPNFSASLCGRIVSKDNATDVWLYNHEDNTVWLKLRILDEAGNVLGETGLLKPGEYVQSVSLMYTPNPGTTITLKLMAYAPQTYHSEGAASLSTWVSE